MKTLLLTICLFVPSVQIFADVNLVKSGSQLVISGDSFHSDYPSVAYNSRQHQFFIGWATDDKNFFHEEAKGRFIDLNRTLKPAKTISIGNGIPSSKPVIAYNSKSNEYLIIWGQFHPSGRNVHARIMESSGRTRILRSYSGNYGESLTYNPNTNTYLMLASQAIVFDSEARVLSSVINYSRESFIFAFPLPRSPTFAVLGREATPTTVTSIRYLSESGVSSRPMIYSPPNSFLLAGAYNSSRHEFAALYDRPGSGYEKRDLTISILDPKARPTRPMRTLLQDKPFGLAGLAAIFKGYVLIYASAANLFAQILNEDGSPATIPLQINSIPAIHAAYIGITVVPGRRMALVTWRSQIAERSRKIIYGQFIRW